MRMRYLKILLLAAGTVAGFSSGFRTLHRDHHRCGCTAAGFNAHPPPPPTDASGATGPG